MNDFKSFGITDTKQGFKGDKIKTDRLLNRQIAVHSYKIEDSKKEAGGKCLHLQISIGNEYYVVFTAGKVLMKMIEQVPKDGFPFTTTMIKENEYLKFT